MRTIGAHLGAPRATLAGLSAFLVLSAVVILLLSGFPSLGQGPSSAHPTTAPVGALPAGAAPARPAQTLASQAAPTVQAHPAAASFYCYPVTATTCVRMANSSEPDIIPVGANHSASVMPAYTDTITLYLMSETKLDYWTGASPNPGPNAPIAMNVTGILWDGDTWFCYCDGTVYHGGAGPTAPYYTYEAADYGTLNTTYKYVYLLQMNNRSASGTPNFYPGETVFWSIEITSYNATSSKYSHQESNLLSYRIKGAWAFSPRVGAVQYGGANAAEADLTVSRNPLQPNWNDTINVTIRTTGPDVTNDTLIGRAVLFVEEWHNGSLTANASQLLFPIETPGGIGGVSNSTVTIPNRFTQVANNVISYWVVARDNVNVGINQTIILPVTNVTVNGNGSFATGVFADDVNVTTDPSSVAYDALTSQAPPVLPGGTNVTVNVTSTNPTTSLLSAQVLYTFSYAALSEKQSGVVALTRVNSTSFRGVIPGMPLNSTINFTVAVNDFTHRLESSGLFNYGMQSLIGSNSTTSELPTLPENATFFYVYVYNNASSSYVSGATLQVRGPTAAWNTVTTTRYGIAYPNATGNLYKPLLLAADLTYSIGVTTLLFTGTGGVHTITVNLTGRHALTNHGTLANGGNYIVLQEGNAIYFWLNGAVSTTIFSPSTGTGTPTPLVIAAIVGLVAAVPVAIVLWLWFREIQARRKAEERRVTL